jgi:hypothetical protein
MVDVGMNETKQEKYKMEVSMKIMAKVIMAVAVVLLSVGMASALPTGPLQIGDKIFDDFAVTGIDPALVSVTTIGSGVPGDWYGIQIQAPFITASIADYGFRYTVRTSSGAALIHDIEQSFNLTSIGNGGIVGIGETVYGSGFGVGNPVAQSSVSYAFGAGDMTDPPGELLQGDQLIVDPTLAKVWVTKDIALVANSGGVVGATILYQRFSQTTVPDGGSTLILLGAAFSGLACWRLRRK